MHQQMVYKIIDVDRFSPTILRCSLFTAGKDMPIGHGLGKRYVYDYELEYFTYGGGAMMIENQVYPIKKGDIVFRRPGQYVEGIMPYCCYLICFDLTGTSGKSHKDYHFANPQEFQPYYNNKVLDKIPAVFHPHSEEAYHSLFASIFENFLNPTESSELLLRSIMLRLIYELHNELLKSESQNIQTLSSPYYIKLKKAKEYMNNYFDKKLILRDIAAISGLSPNYFHRIFTETFDVTPAEYLNKLRMDKAREYLVKTAIPVNSIALMCGYDNIPYFSTVFKSYNNISPGEFRKRYCYTQQ